MMQAHQLYNPINNPQAFGLREANQPSPGMVMQMGPGQNGVAIHKRVNSISFPAGTQANGLAM